MQTHSSGVGRDGDTPESRLSDNSPPSSLSVGKSLQEERAGKQVLELGVLSVSGGDVGQEDGLSLLAFDFSPSRGLYSSP